MNACKPMAWALAAMLALMSDAEAAVGKIQFVAGTVKIVNAAGQARAAQKGGDIEEGDMIVTEKLSSLQVRLSDGGFLAVRPDTQLAIDKYVFSGKADGSERSFLSLLKGGFRTITGLIGRFNKQNYQIKTPTATIGIRGTDHEPMVILPPAPGETPLGAPGTYDKVNAGMTYLQTQGGTIDIGPNQVGFSPDEFTPPVQLPQMPDFYQGTPPPLQEGGAGADQGGGLQRDSAGVDAAAAEGAPVVGTPPLPDAAPSLQSSVPITGTGTGGGVVDMTNQSTSSCGRVTGGCLAQ